MEQCKELLMKIINDNTNTQYDIGSSHKCYDYLKTNLPKNIIFEEKTRQFNGRNPCFFFDDLVYAKIQSLPKTKYLGGKNI